MDDLYDNLENYNEANVIEELRNENQDLKAKVEKCTATIEKLQKDFDKLEAEYKKLELNYSSLLKTARAEVERKTQIITNLNHEKDMMVLNAIQNKNVLNIRRNWPMGKANNIQPKANNLENNNKKTAADQPKTRSSSTGRKEASGATTEDTTTTASTENANKLNIKNEKSVGRASDAKENVGESMQKARPARAASIRSRRKSMPASRLTKFSSDEEGEISSPPRDTKASQPVFRENDAWGGNRDRNYTSHDRLDYNSKNRMRNYGNEKFRGGDRFEAQKNRFSPERFYRRSKKDYLVDHRSHRLLRDSSGGYRSEKDGEQKSYRDGSGDPRRNRDRSGDFRPHRDSSGEHKSRREDTGDRYQRPEHRKRRLESPPREKYDQYQQKNHEQFEKDYYEERSKYLEDQTRVKYLSDYEEPSHKRLRTDSHHSSEQDSRAQPGQDLDLRSQHLEGTLQVRDDDMSCQSPDYLATELASMPKEIKIDSEIKLDDPREQSKRYIIRTENGEKVLSTVVGRNIDLKPLKNLACNLPKVQVPKALVIPPSKFSDTVKYIYDNMDVDNSASDISSVESGETMGSVYDIDIDPYQYRRKKHYKKNIQPKENVEDLPLTYQEYTIQTGVKNSEKHAMVSENNIQDLKVSGKEIMQIDNVGKCPRKSKERDVYSENVAKTQQNKVTAEKNPSKNEHEKSPEKVYVSTETVADAAQIQTEHVAILVEKVPEVSQNYEKVDKQTEKLESTCKVTLTFEKTKYEIPKIKKDQSGNERKHLDEIRKNREADKNDNISDTRLVGDMKQKHEKEPVVVTGKGMVEGDLELSDENSDNLDLEKHIPKEFVEHSMPDLSKPNVEEKKVIDKDRNKDATESIKQKSHQDDFSAKNIALKQRIERTSMRKSSDSNYERKSKKKMNKKIVDKETKQTEAQQSDALNKETKQKIPETIMSKDMKNKFSDLFGDTSSLVTPEDLGLTANETRIESSSPNYLSIFEDAQDAIGLDTKVTGQTKKAVAAVSLEKSCLNKTKPIQNIGKEIQNDLSDVINTKSRPIIRKLTDKDKKHSVEPIDAKETKSKCGKTKDKEKQVDNKVEVNESKQSKHVEKQNHGNKKTDLSENKLKPKSRKNIDTEKQTNILIPTTDHQENGDKMMEVEEQKHKSKTSNNTEIEHLKPIDAIETNSTTKTEEKQHHDEQVETADAQPKYIETKRRKSGRNEEKSQLRIDTGVGELPQPAIISVENMDTSAQTTEKVYPNDFTPKEPDVVKTVVISSGIQPSGQEMPVNNFSPILLEPPVTPNIDNRQTRVEIPLLSHSVHIHALATSTPAKEIALHDVQEDVSGTPYVSNASDQTSQSNINSQNDMDEPDFRVFVKRRRRRVIKKTTPSKT